MQNNVCELCGEGCLEARVSYDKVSYNGVQKSLPLHFSICDACGAEQALPVQTRNNKRIMNAFKKEVDGLLPGQAVAELREKFKISQTQAAKIFGGGPVAFAKYESNDVIQSNAMDKLLRVALNVQGAFQYLAELAAFDDVQLHWLNVTEISSSSRFLVDEGELSKYTDETEPCTASWEPAA